MTLADFRWIVDQSKGRVFQFALGGRGDPELHPDFEEMLMYSRENGIVPNMTTSGFMLDEKKAQLIARYCGAAAVSWYGTEYTMKAIDLLAGAGVKTNIHFVLGKDSIDQAIGLLSAGIPQGLNRIVFLLYKPVGQAGSDNVLSASDPRVKQLFGMMDEEKAMSIVGFDSCCVPAVVNHTSVMDRSCFDCCEGGRFSAYITPDMKMLPCSFDQQMRWAVDLRHSTIQEAWDGPEFEDFRSRMRLACPGCKDKELCMGGCPVTPEIVLCEKKHLFRSKEGDL
jgi:radical SAM protein with 4Fe4S-binding SPASM domain